MKIVGFDQNSKEWYTWRGLGLGASDAASVLGISPWTSRLELWLDRTGIMKRPEPNVFAAKAMQRGHDLEPAARKIFETRQGRLFPAVSAEHDEFAFIRASLDGYNAETNELLEIKCPGKADYAKALKGEIPKKYYAQIQQQFLVTNATKGYYVSYDGVSPEVVVIEVLPDHEFQANLLKELKSFWELVSENRLPEVESSDIVKLVKQLGGELDKANSTLSTLKLVSGNLK